MSVFAVFFAIVAGLMAVAFIALLITLIVLAVKSRGTATEATLYRND